ncbi:MAG: hypothetical protein CK426_01680 [Legionella sp.]|nr:MAG: hypothetical protein CK423_00010 [Legionella sp.]PJD99520.1 MAG: hypothetical protein CK426_01680 [Legionella sp.]
MIKEIIQNILDLVTETTKAKSIKTLQLFTAEELDLPSILHNVVHKYSPQQGLLILSILEALQLENAISQALTQCDDKGLNLYYQALAKDPTIGLLSIHLINKLAKYSESLSTDEQILIHFNPKALQQAGLYQFISPDHFFKLELCLQLIFKLAQADEQFNHTVDKHLLAHRFAPYDFLRIILASENQQLIALVINHFKEKAFFCLRKNPGSPQIIHILTYNHSPGASAIAVIFNELNKSIANRVISPTIYASILLNTFTHNKENIQRTLLSTGLLDPNKCELILTEARRAFDRGWLSSNEYYQFLFNHPSSHLGFNFLHEAIRAPSYKIFYLYITHCLNAIAQNIQLLGCFRQQLLTPNKVNYSLLHQGVNNQFIENTELILNLFYLLLPEKVVKEQLITELGYMRKKAEGMTANHLVDQVNIIIKKNMPCLIPIVIESPGRLASDEEQLAQKKQLNAIVDTIYIILDRHQSVNEATLAKEAYPRHGFLPALIPNPQARPYASRDHLDMDCRRGYF